MKGMKKKGGARKHAQAFGAMLDESRMHAVAGTKNIAAGHALMGLHDRIGFPLKAAAGGARKYLLAAETGKARRVAPDEFNILAGSPGPPKKSDFEAACGHCGDCAVEDQFAAAELRKALAHKNDPPLVAELDGIAGVRHVRGVHPSWYFGAVVPRLSLIVIARNEEASIGRCLQSASFADEMVVVDNQSSDKTVEIALGLGAKVIQAADWPGFGPQKNRALDAATGDWVLSLDADEWIEPPLADAIKAAIADPNAADGFEMPRRSRFCGQVVRHCGWWPDYVTRLWRRDKGRFADVPVHERVIVNGKVARLKEPIEHDAIADLDDARDKAVRYAKAAAKSNSRRRENVQARRKRLCGGAAGAFLRTYIWRAGFLTAQTGWRVAVYNADYTYRKWAGVGFLIERSSPLKSSVALGVPMASRYGT
jgi:hypothetical protein